MCCYVLIINLILHVVLRGLWIGAIGLRYVSSEIDYEALNYGKRFTKYLQKTFLISQRLRNYTQSLYFLFLYIKITAIGLLY